MITVIDPDAARAALAAGRLGCPLPGCAGLLRVWSRARPRTVCRPDGQGEQVHPDRARCRACRVSHVLLPAWCLPRRAYDAEVIGAALLAAADGAGHAEAAAAAGAPVGTVRGWLRAVARTAPALTAQALSVAQAAGDTSACLPGPTPPLSPLAAAVNALAAAARAFQLTLARPRPSVPRHGGLTGIDYLALIGERHRRDLVSGLRLADPTGAAAHASPWQLVNVITAGRLLTTPSG